MSLYGYPRPTTPNLDRLEGESAVFDWAVAPSSWTLPSHASMFTGRRPGELGVGWRVPFDGRAPTLAEALHDRGYATGAFVANLYYTTHESGLSRGFMRFVDYRVTAYQVFFSANLIQLPLVQRLLQARRPRGIIAAFRNLDLRVPSEPKAHHWRSEDVAREFLDWQSSLEGRPFFAFLNLFGAHDRHRVPPPWRTRFSTTPQLVDLYDGGIAMDDAAVGIILDSLRARGILDRTLVVVTSDHGEHLGEHGLTGHGTSLYLPVLRIPLLVRWPEGLPAARRSDAVTLADLPATVLTILGARDHPFPGASWFAPPENDSELVHSEVGPADNPETPAGRGSLHSLLGRGFHYIHAETGDEELYDLAADSSEAHNLAQVPEYREVLRAMRGALSDRVPGAAFRNVPQ